MSTFSRREMLAAPAVLAATTAVATAATDKKMTLAMHQNTSNGAGYRKSLEGWARAGIKDVEITNLLLDEFLKTDSLGSARQVITDLGLNPVQGATGVSELFEPNPNRAAALDNLKRRCEMYANLGLNRVYATTAHQQENYRGRLQGWCPEHSRCGRRCQTVQHVATDRVPAHVALYLHLTDDSESDARRGTPQRRAHARLLSFLVRPEQTRGPRPDSAWGNRPCAFSGRARHAARNARFFHAHHTGRRSEPADADIGQAFRKRIRRAALRGALSPEVPAR